MDLIRIVMLMEFINGLNIQNQFIEEPKDREEFVGSTVLLHCRTKLIDQNQVNWCKNDFCTLGKTRDLPFYPRYEIIGNILKGEHHFQITNFSWEDVGTYQCQIRAGYERPPAMSRKAKLTLLQIPTNISIDNPIELIENVPSNVICRSNNAMPEAKLSWLLPKSIKSFSISDYILINDKSLRNSISNLTFIPNRSLHNQFIQCQANSSAIQLTNSTILTQQYIHILFKPELKLLIIGQLIEGERIEIVVQMECRPNCTLIKWFNGNDILLNETNSTKISLILNRSIYQKKIFCQVQNSIGITNQSIDLNFIYRPRFIDRFGNEINQSKTIELVSENETIQLECYVDSYPLTNLYWIFNQQRVFENIHQIKIENISMEKHLGMYQCCVQHPFFGLFNRSILLKFKSPPEFISNELVYSTSIHRSIEIICSLSKDLPIQEMEWLKEDEVKIQSNEKYEITKKEEKELIELKLKIENIEMKDQGIYKCRSTNQYGSAILLFHLIINKNFLYFIENQFFYLTISLGLFLSLFFILFLLKSFYSSSKTKSTRLNSDQQIILQQSLIQNHIQDLLNTDEQFYSSKTYSTIV